MRRFFFFFCCFFFLFVFFLASPCFGDSEGLCFVIVAFPGYTHLYFIYFVGKDTKHFRGMDTVSGEIILSDCIISLLKKGSALKGKNLLPKGANSFLLE